MKLKEIIRKSNIVNTLMTQEEYDSPKQSKLKHAIKRSNARVEELVVKNNSDLADIRVDLASIDEKGNLIVSADGKYSYTPANEKEARARAEKLQEQEVEFEPYLFMHESELVEPLDEFTREELVGFFLPDGNK